MGALPPFVKSDILRPKLVLWLVSQIFEFALLALDFLLIGINLVLLIISCIFPALQLIANQRSRT